MRKEVNDYVNYIKNNIYTQRTIKSLEEYLDAHNIRGMVDLELKSNEDLITLSKALNILDRVTVISGGQLYECMLVHKSYVKYLNSKHTLCFYEMETKAVIPLEECSRAFLVIQ